MNCNGPSHNCQYTMGVSDEDGNILGQGTEKTKKKAEQLASKNALELLNSE